MEINEGDEGDRVLVFWEPKEKTERREKINKISGRCSGVTCSSHGQGSFRFSFIIFFLGLNKQAFGIGSGKFGPVLHFQYFQHFSCIFS